MRVELAVLLGILQGLTEFFPVSSSGHLALAGHWFGLHEPDLRFDILVHLATLAAIFVYFRKDWLQLAKVLANRDSGDMPRAMPIYLIVASIPAALVGIFLKDHISMIHGQPQIVGICLLVTGVTLLAGLRLRKQGLPLDKLTWGVVIAMGLAQALAVMPGISRAGTTIMMGLFLGLGRQAAARFSFLMAVPVIGGAGLLAIKDLFETRGSLTAEVITAYGAGFVAALLSGFFALVFLMRLLEARRFFYFGFYCLIVGSLAILLG